MFRKLNVFVLTFFVLIQSFIMPFSASAAPFESILMGAAMAAAEGDKAESGSAGETKGTVDDDTFALSFEELIMNGVSVKTQEDANKQSPQKDDLVTLGYTFEIVEAMAKDGTYVFNLPPQLLIFDAAKLSGNIPSNTSLENADFTYVTDAKNKTVTITAVKGIPQGYTGGINFMAKFGDFNGESLDQTLEIPNTKFPGLDFTFKPKEQAAGIVKTNEIVTDVEGNKSLKWTVWFNQNGLELGEITFEDKLEEGHKYKQDSLTVETADVIATLDKTIVDESTLTPVTPTNQSITDNVLKFNITPGKKAVKVTYETDITRDITKENEIFKNIATVKGAGVPTEGWTATSEADVAYDAALRKTVVTNDKYEAEWLIEFNKLGKQIIADETKITDTIAVNPENQHSIMQDTLTVNKVVKENGAWVNKGPLDASQYDIKWKAGNLGFDITLKKPGNYALDIKYKTLSDKAYITKDSNVSNTVDTVLEDVSYDKTASMPSNEGIGTKSDGVIDYGAREITWTLTYKTEKTAVNDLTITDDIPEGLTLIKDSFAVTSDSGLTLEDFDINPTDNKFVATLKDKPDFKGAFTLTYKTSYANLNNYGTDISKANNVTFNWNGGEIKKTGTFKPSPEHTKNASKKGSFDYNAREFNWQAVVNYDRVTLPEGTVIDDAVGTGHEITGNVEVFEATVLPGGNVSEGQRVTDVTVAIKNDNTGFTITTQKDDNRTFIIKYKTKDSDDIIGQTDNTGVYKNTIKISNGDTNYGGVDAEVKVNNPNAIVAKTAETKPNSSTVDWTVEINKSNSLLQDVVLKDALSSTNTDVKQKLIQNSVKIEGFTFNADGTLKSVGVKNAKEDDMTDWGIKTIALNDNGFEFNFDDLGDTTGPNSFKVTYSTYYDGPHEGNYKNGATLNIGNATLPDNIKTESKSEWDKKYEFNDSNAYGGYTRTNLVVTKIGTNADTGAKNPLANVEFELWNADNTIKLYGPDGLLSSKTYTTGANGQVSFEGVGYGHYTLREITTVDGFKKADDTKITISKDSHTKLDEYTTSSDGAPTADKPVQQVVKNEEYVDSVKLTKTFEGAQPGEQADLLKQVQFALYKADDTRIIEIQKAEFNNGVRTLVTDQDENLTFTPKADGSIYIPYLEPGEYYFKEVQTAPGYKLIGKTETFTIVDGATQQVESDATNKPLKVTITNVEGDPTDETPPTNEDPKIEGSTFELYTEDGSCPKPGDGYTPPTGKTPVTKYTDGTAIPLTTNSNGQIEIDFSKLPPGKYVVVQKQVQGDATEKYYDNRENVVATCFDVTTETTEEPPPVIFENERTPSTATVKVIKTEADAEEMKIEGAIFKLKGTLNAKSKTYIGKTDENGEITEWFEGKDESALSGSAVTSIASDNYILTEIKYPSEYEELVLKGEVPGVKQVGKEISFTFKNDSTNIDIPVTNTKIKRNIIINDSCTLGERVYEIYSEDGKKVLQNDGTLVNIEDSKDPVRITLAEEETTKTLESVSIPAGKYQFKQISTTNPECGQTTTPGFEVEPDVPSEPTGDFKVNLVTINFKTCGEGTVNGEYVFENTTDSSQKYTITVKDNENEAVKNIPEGTYKVTKDGKVIVENVTIKETGKGTQAITVYTEDCLNDVTVPVTFLGGAGCLENDNVTLTLKRVVDGNDKDVDRITFTESNKSYAISADNTVIVDGIEYSVGVGDAGTINGQEYTKSVYTIIVKKNSPTTSKQEAVFENLPQGTYKVVTNQNDCLPGTGEIPVTPEEPPTKPVEEKPKTPGDIKTTVQFTGGNGCLENGDDVILTLKSDGKNVDKITIGTGENAVTYGVLNGQTIVNGKVYEEKDGVITIGDQSYEVTEYKVTVTKDGENTAEQTFTNLVPANYTVEVTEGDCVVPTTPPTVPVTPGKPTNPPVVPFEETPTPGSIKVPVTFIDGNGCLVEGTEVQVTLQAADGKPVQTIEADGKIYGIYNNQAIIDGKLIQVTIPENADTVEVNGKIYTVGTAVKTINKKALTTENVIFENLVPGEYKVVVTGGDCLTETPPTTVPPGGTPEVPVEETPNEPGNIKVPVTFVGGLGCLTGTEVTVMLKDANGQEVQAIEVDGIKYGVANNAVIVEGKLYTAIDGKFTINGETKTPILYTEVANKIGVNTATVLFTNLVPGNYTVEVTQGDCVVPTTPPTTTVPPGKTPEVPFEEQPKSPGDITAKVTFIGGAGCLEGTEVVVTLKDKDDNVVNHIEIDGEKYGVLNNEVIVKGKLYGVVDNKVTIDGTEYETKPYTATISKVANADNTATFTNLVPGTYKVMVENSDCIVPTSPTPTVDVEPGKEVPPVTFEEQPRACSDEFIKVTGEVSDGATITIDNEKINVTEIPLKTPGGTYDVHNLNGNKIGTLKIGEPTTENPCPEATFNALVCENEFMTPPTTVPPNSTVEIDGKEVPVDKVPTSTPPGTYPVKDSEGKPVGELEVVPGTEEDPCPTTTYKPEKAPTCPKEFFDVPSEVEPGSTVEIDGKEVPVDKVPTSTPSGKYPVKDPSGKPVGELEVVPGTEEDPCPTATYKPEKAPTCPKEFFDVPSEVKPGSTVEIDGKEVPVDKVPTSTPSGKYPVKDPSGKPVGELEVVPGTEEDPCPTASFVPKESPTCPKEFFDVPSEVEPGSTVEIDDKEVPVEEIPTSTPPGKYPVKDPSGKPVGELEVVPGTEEDPCPTTIFTPEKAPTCTQFAVEVTLDGKLVPPGVVVTLQSTTDVTKQLSATTDANGVATFNDAIILVPGDYNVIINEVNYGEVSVAYDNTNCGVPVKFPGTPEAPTCPKDFFDVPPGITPGSTVEINGKEVPVEEIPTSTPPGKYPVKDPSGKPVGELEVVPGTEEDPCPTTTFTPTPPAPTCPKDFLDVPPGITPGSTVEIDGEEVPVDKVPTSTPPGKYPVKDKEGKPVGELEVVPGTEEDPCSTTTFTPEKAPTCDKDFLDVPPGIEPGSTVEIDDKEVPVGEIPTSTTPGTYPVKDPSGKPVGELEVVPGTEEDPCPTTTFTPTPEAPTCDKDFLDVPPGITPGSTVEIDEKEVPVDKVPTSTPPGKYPVKDPSGKPVGELEVVPGTEEDPCPTTTFTPTPEAPTCDKDFLDVPPGITPGSTVEIDDKEVPVEEIPTSTPPGKYPVKDPSGKPVGELEVVPGTEEDPCPTTTFTPEKAPTCDKDITVPVTPGTTIEVNGKPYADDDNDGNVIVPGTELEPGKDYDIKTPTGETVGKITIDEKDCTVTIIYTGCTAGTFTAPELAGQTITLVDAQGQETTVTVDASGKAVVPFINGTFTVKDTTGTEIGSITMKDCGGTFTLTTPTCTKVTVTLPGYAAGTEVVIKNNGEVTVVEVQDDHTVTVPFTEGLVTFSVDDKVIGNATLVDCEGTFVPTTNACDQVTASLPDYAGQTVTLTLGNQSVDVIVAVDGTVAIPTDDAFDVTTEGPITIDVMVEGQEVAQITVENCKATVQPVVPVVPEIPEIPIVPVLPPTPGEGDACDETIIKVPGAPTGSTVNIDGEDVSVTNISTSTPADTYDVYNDGKKVGTITITAGATAKDCPTATFTPVDTPDPETPEYPVEIDPNPSCDYIPAISYTIVDEAGKTVVTVNSDSNTNKTLTLPVGTYTVNSKGKVIETFTVKPSTETQKVTVKFDCSGATIIVTPSDEFGTMTPPPLNIVPVVDGKPQCDNIKGQIVFDNSKDKVVIDISNLPEGEYALVDPSTCGTSDMPPPKFEVPTNPNDAAPPIEIEVKPTPNPDPNPEEPNFPEMPPTKFEVEFNPACVNEATLVYNIYKTDGSLYDVVKPDANGKIKLQLPVGSYLVEQVGKETNERIQVMALSTVQTYTFLSQEECQENPVDPPVDPPIEPEKPVIVEFEENPACEANQTYAIYTAAGDFVQNVITNDQGLAIAFLPTGDYILKNADGVEVATFTATKGIGTNKVTFSTICIDGTDPENPGENPDPENPGENPDPENPGENPDPENPGENPDPENPGENPDPENPGENPDSENPDSENPPGDNNNNNTGGNNNNNSGGNNNTGGNNNSNNSGNNNGGTNNGTGNSNGNVSNNNGSNAGNKLPQTNVESSSGYLQLLGLLVLVLAAFVFIRRRKLNK